MKEKGIDIPTNKTKLLTQKMANDADLIITMGHGGSGSCSGPFFEETVDCGLEDSKGKSIDMIREIRDEIEHRVKQLIFLKNNLFYQRKKGI